jgi:NTP pyrophosphatase (non-canonical NTP hydrolase)
VGQGSRPPRSGSLRLIQVERDHWVAHNFPNDRIEDSFMGMVEEMGELAHHLLKSKQGIRGGDVDHEAEIRDACADLVIFMLGIASHKGFDLMDAILEAWDEVRHRDWIKYPKNGVTE